MQRQFLVRSLIVASVLVFASCFVISTVRADSEASPDHVVRVATTGNNTADCGGAGNPCRTLQHAVNRAANEQWVKILVAGGVYTRRNGDASPCDNLDIDAVACIINRRVEMIGGYSTNDWTQANPQANPTVIDGQGARRGVMMLNVSEPDNTLAMTGFTIRRGLGTGISSRSGNDAISGFGGGIFVDSAGATLRNLHFENNKAVGHNRNSGHGGAAAGGALAIRGAVGTVVMDQIEFVNNRVEGGSGAVRGGYAIGGGLFTYRAVIRASNIFAEGNVALAGSSNGSGVDGDGELSDAQGGALAFHLDTDVRLSNAEILSNRAVGGAAPNGNAGGAFGGGIFSEEAANVVLLDSLLRGNSATGGNGINNDAPFRGAGFGHGGGLRLSRSPARIERVSIIDNVAQGGAGERYKGSAGGGGIALTSQTNQSIRMVNVVVAGNRARMGGGPDASVGGGGGGIWAQGADVVIDHATIAGNELRSGSTLQGTAIALVDRAAPNFQVTVRNSIIAQHAIGGNAQGILVQTGGTFRFQNVMVAENSGDLTGGPGSVNGTGSITSVDAIGFLSSGAPDFDYGLSPLSPAINGAPSSTMGTDRDNNDRDGTPDLGAYEGNAFQVAVAPVAADALRIRWTEDPLIRSYRMSITCSRGASPPDQGSCNSPMLFNNVTSANLTGLTPYRRYVIAMEALDGDGAVIAAAAPVEAFPTDIFVFLPMAAK